MRWFAYVCAMIVLASSQPSWASFDFEPFSAGSKFDTAGGRCTDSKPVIAISPTSLVFANTSTGQTRTARVSVTNSGSVAWTGIGYSNFASNVFAHVTAGQSPCGTTLAAGATCNHDVSCTPVDTSTATDGFSFTSDQFAAKAVTVSCTGVTTAPTFILSENFTSGSTPTGWPPATSYIRYNYATPPAPLEGSYSLVLDTVGTSSAQTATPVSYAGQTDVYVAFRFAFHTATNGDNYQLISLQNATSGDLCGLTFRLSGAIRLDNTGATQSADLFTPVIDTDYLLKIRYQYTGSAAIATFWTSTNNGSTWTQRGQTTNGTSTTANTKIKFYSGSANNNQLIFDTIRVSATDIGVM